MAWFGSGISQITGQISNFTKEVLTEGTEEVDDHATELRLSKSRIAEMENYCETQKAEGQRLEQLNKELAEKLEAAELQISAISTQYRESLNKKEEEIRGLKQQLNELHLEPQMLDESLLSPVAHSIVSEFGHGDEHDFDELVTSQHEINRLRSKVQRLQAECHRWQQVHTSQAAGDLHSKENNGEDGNTVVSLQRQVNDLQQQLASCVDQNQHELTALQDLHTQKLSAVIQRQKGESQAHEEKIANLVEQLQAFESGSSTCGHEKELSSLREHVRHLEEINGKMSTDLEQMHAADREKGRLLAELREQLKQLEEDHAKVKKENVEVSSQHALLLEEIDALTEERQMLKMRLYDLEQRSADTKHDQATGDVTSQSHDHVADQSNTQDLEQQLQTLTSELDACRREIDEFDLVKSDWAMEKEALEEVLLTMREQLSGKTGEEDGEKDRGMKDDDVLERLKFEQENVSRLEKELQQNAVSASALDEVKQALEASTKEAETTKHELQEKCSEMNKLQHRLNETEQEIEESNEKISRLSKQLETTELAMEDNLEQEVGDLRKQLKAKNEELMDANVELEEMKTQVEEEGKQADALRARLEEQALELEDAGAEKEQLSSSIEELDSQHEEAMSQVIATRQNLQSENRALQERCAALESAKLVNETKQTSNDDEMKSRSKEEVNELKEKLDKAAMSLNELHMDKKELENEVVSLKGKIADLQKKLKAGTSEVMSLKQKNLELEIDVTSAREELSLLKQSVAARDDLGQLRKQFEESWNESSRKEMSMELHQEVAMLKADLAAAQMEKEVVTRQLEQMKNHGDQAAHIVPSQSSVELLARIDSLQNQNESLEKLLSDTEEKLTEIRQLYDAQIVMTEGHAAQVRHLNQLVDSLTQEREVVKKQLKDSKEKLREESQRCEREKGKNQESDAKMSSLEARCADLEKNKVMLDESLREKRDIAQAWEESKGFIATLRVENDGLLRDKESSTKLIRQQRVEIERLGIAASLTADPEEGSSEMTNEVQTDTCRKESTDRRENADGTDQMNGRKAPSDMNMAELENLRKIISLKDNVVMELKASNASLLRLLEERSLELHGDRVLVEIHELGAEVANLRREKEQMMSVLNEKTRDCSSSRTEVHRLMGVVSSQKAALARMQDDNNILQRSASVSDTPVDNSNTEMSREAIKQLSQVIRNKDVEIEALRQKSDTLIAVLQEQSADGAADQISTLMRERDNLAKQISVYVDDRNQIVAALNNKHEECVAYHTEAGRLAELLATNSTEKDKLQHEYEKLTWEFENKKQAQLKAQNELVGLRQKCAESNRLYLDLKQSGVRLDLTNDVVGDDGSTQNGGHNVQKLMVVIENQRAAVCEKDEMIAKNMTALQEKEQRLLECDQSLLERDQLLSEREKSINELRVQLHRAEEFVSQKETQLSNANKQQQHSTFQLQGLQTEVVDLRSKCTQLAERNDVLLSEMNNLRETHGRVSRAISDKEFELAAAQEKINSLSQRVRQDTTPGGASSGAEVETLMREKEAIHQQVALLRQERDQLVSALQQTQVENEQLQGKILQLSEREQKLTRELDRLRNHLLAIEENYTHEALDSEEREKELRNRLAQAEERLLSSSSLVESASQQASQQVETLQQQLHVIAEQRDGALLQLANSQEMASQYATSLANLQMVLEQFQHERDIQQAADIDRCQKELKASHKEVRQLKQQLADMQEQLDEKCEALEAASRLSEQLDRKEEMIHALREEVQLREKELTAAEEKVAALSGFREAKVDKALVKNLLIGYFHTPSGKRIEVLKLMCKVLDFNADEMQQIGAETNSGWLGGLLRRVTPSTPTKTNKSFSQLFVNFLETESTPKLQPRLPAEAMAKEQHQRHEERHQKHTFNPFTATASTPTGRHLSAEDSHLLMKPIAASLPMFTPIVAPTESASRGSSGRSTPASSTTILRDVLQQ